MTEDKSPSPFDDLDARLRAAMAARRKPEEAKNGGPVNPMQGIGLAFRIGVELVAALVVGAGIGWLLDTWLGTLPWFLLVFLVLGFAAGILNVYRAVSGIGMAFGYVDKDKGKEDTPDQRS